MEKIEYINDDKWDFFKIEPASIEGCNIGGFLALPKGKMQTNKLLVTFKEDKKGATLKDGSKVESFDDSVKRATIEHENVAKTIGEYLGLEGQCILFPMLPNDKRISESLGHEVDFGGEFFGRECFERDENGNQIIPEVSSNEYPNQNKYYRLDNQVEKMIENVKQFIEQEKNLSVDDKINLFGHSTAGVSAMRFAGLEPELIDTLIIGGALDQIPIFLGEKSKELDWPLGTKEYEEKFGKEFDEKAFKDIKCMFYTSEFEYADPNLDGIRDSNYGDGTTGDYFVPEEIADEYKNLFNQHYRENQEASMFERGINVLNECKKEGANIKVFVTKGECHDVVGKDTLRAAQFTDGQVVDTEGKTIKELSFSEDINKVLQALLNKTLAIQDVINNNEGNELIEEYKRVRDRLNVKKTEKDVITRVKLLNKIVETFRGEIELSENNIIQEKNLLSGKIVKNMAKDPYVVDEKENCNEINALLKSHELEKQEEQELF